MLIKKEEEPILKLTIFHCSGILKIEELKHEVKTFHDGEPTLNTLYDLSQTSLQGLDHTVPHEWSRFQASELTFDKRKGGKTAIVAPTDLLYGTARLAETLFNDKVPQEIRVFRSKSEALGWISENTDQKSVDSAEQV